MVHPDDPLADTSCTVCTPEALLQLLRADPALQARWQTLPRRALQTGEVLLRQGAPAATAWWIERGLLRFCYRDAEGAECNRSFHVEGAWVAGGMPPHVGPSPYAIEALERTQVVEMSYEELGRCQQAFPLLSPLLAEALNFTFRRQAEREAQLLTLEPAERYQVFLARQPQAASRLALHHVASYLGITNVALSRIRRRLGLGDARKSAGVKAPGCRSGA